MTGWIGIALGDVTGIGPEVTLKALATETANDDTRYLLLGDARHLAAAHEKLGLNLPLRPFTDYSAAGRFFSSTPCPRPCRRICGPARPKPPRPRWHGSRREPAAVCAMSWTLLVTAPLNKHAVVQSGQAFVGQTEFLSQLAGTERTIMMLLGEDDRGRWLRVALATTHLPLKLVAAQLRAEKIELAIALAAQACRDLGLARQRVAVCGLNPHAGEGGEFGDEEITTIGPVVQSARQKGLDVVGPLPADTLFYQAYRGDYDAVVAMYHDQGLAPMKMVAFESGVNWTLGLPFIRTSPDHGTAYDIAGQGKAEPSSMRAALRLARQLACGRQTSSP